MTVHRALAVSEVGDVTVVRFVERKILDEASIQELGAELFRLVEEEGPPRQIFANPKSERFRQFISSIHK